jgi:F0F1-type ATP synthase membrane subunit b/b'
MGKDDLIISIISFTVLLIFVFNPMLKKILRKVDKKQSDVPPREDPAYNSIDSLAQKILSSNEEVKKFSIVQHETVNPAAEELRIKNKSVTDRIEKQSALRKAVIWKEILSAPVSLKDPDPFF